jgi:hypothetical protein
MTHDPLCPRTSHPKFCEGCTPQCGTCQCDLIAKVRADEQQQVARRLTAYHAKGCIGGTSNLGCGCGLWMDVLTYSVEQP